MITIHLTHAQRAALSSALRILNWTEFEEIFGKEVSDSLAEAIVSVEVGS